MDTGIEACRESGMVKPAACAAFRAWVCHASRSPPKAYVTKAMDHEHPSKINAAQNPNQGTCTCEAAAGRRSERLHRKPRTGPRAQPQEPRERHTPKPEVMHGSPRTNKSKKTIDSGRGRKSQGLQQSPWLWMCGPVAAVSRLRVSGL